jgi:hypothetical protein
VKSIKYSENIDKKIDIISFTVIHPEFIRFAGAVIRLSFELAPSLKLRCTMSRVIRLSFGLAPMPGLLCTKSAVIQLSFIAATE